MCMTKWDGCISGMQGWLYHKLLTINFFDCKCLTLSFWLLRYPRQRHLSKKKQHTPTTGISRKLQSIWHPAAFRGWLDGTGSAVKRRHDLKGSCWSSVLQIKSKQALCNSLLCFYFFLVLYCCLSFPNTINVPCQLYILNPNAIVFSPRIWHLLLLVHGKEGKWAGGRVACTCANVSHTRIFIHHLIPKWQHWDQMTSTSFRSLLRLRLALVWIHQVRPMSMSNYWLKHPSPGSDSDWNQTTDGSGLPVTTCAH